MKNEKLVPKIRFKGFTDPWEQRKLEDITVKIGSGKTPRGGDKVYTAKGILFLRSQNIHDDVVDINNGIKFISSEMDFEMKNTRVIKADVLLNITGASIGRSAVYRIMDKANVNQHVAIIRLNNPGDADLIQMLLSSELGQKQINSYQAGGAREGLNFKQIGNMFFLMPRSRAEKRKISNQILRLNCLIAANEDKVKQLKELKKLLMQKIFSQEWRFKGFTDPWEQRKLPEIADRLSESSDSIKFPHVEYADIISGSGKLKPSFTFDLSDDRSGILFRKHDVLYGKLRPYLNNWLFPDFNGIAVGDFWVFRAKKSISKSFLFALIQSPSYQQVANISTGTKMPRSDWKKVAKTSFEIPNQITEQRKIGTYINSLDHLIAANEDKVDQLKRTKQFLMQNVFI